MELQPTMTVAEMEDLRFAKGLLERPGLTAKLANFVGGPIERGFKLLPKDWSETVNKAVRGALFKGLEVASSTFSSSKPQPASDLLHKFMVGASGTVGGAFGFAAMMIEMPVSTTIMLRSIADIARSEGHNLSDPEVRLGCLEVFALGGQAEPNPSESAYFAVRAALSKAVADAAAYVTEKGVVERSAPAVIKLITNISSRFGLVVSEQVAAKAVPVVGAAGGAVINVMFMNHFQDMARGHFIVKRLENQYGPEAVRATYDSLPIRSRS